MKAHNSEHIYNWRDDRKSLSEYGIQGSKSRIRNVFGMSWNLDCSKQQLSLRIVLRSGSWITTCLLVARVKALDLAVRDLRLWTQAIRDPSQGLAPARTSIPSAHWDRLSWSHQQQRFSLGSGGGQLTTARESESSFERSLDNTPSSVSQLYKASRFQHIQIRFYLAVVLCALQTNTWENSSPLSLPVQIASEMHPLTLLSLLHSSDRVWHTIHFMISWSITLSNHVGFSDILLSWVSMLLPTPHMNEPELGFLQFGCLTCIRITTSYI